MSCSPAVMYSVCKPDISETSRSEPVYALLAIISSEHTQQGIWNLHTAGSYSSLSACSLGVHLMFSVLFLTVTVHHQQPQQVMDLILFLIVLYLLGIIFLYLKWPTYTWTTQHRKRNNSTVSCQLIETAVGGGEIPIAVLKIQSFETLRPVEWSIYRHLQGQQFKMIALGSTETSVTLNQPTGRNYHQHLCENVMAQNRIRAELLCMTRLLRICEITTALTKAPHWTYFSFRALYIKTSKCTILPSLYSLNYI